MSEATSCPPSVVADTIMRTIELGVTITEAAVDEKQTTIFCTQVAGDPPEFGHYWSVTFGKSFLPAGFGVAVVVAGY